MGRFGSAQIGVWGRSSQFAPRIIIHRFFRQSGGRSSRYYCGYPQRVGRQRRRVERLRLRWSFRLRQASSGARVPKRDSLRLGSPPPYDNTCLAPARLAWSGALSPAGSRLNRAHAISSAPPASRGQAHGGGRSTVGRPHVLPQSSLQAGEQRSVAQ